MPTATPRRHPRDALSSPSTCRWQGRQPAQHPRLRGESSGVVRSSPQGRRRGGSPEAGPSLRAAGATWRRSSHELATPIVRYAGFSVPPRPWPPSRWPSCSRCWRPADGQHTQGFNAYGTAGWLPSWGAVCSRAVGADHRQAVGPRYRCSSPTCCCSRRGTCSITPGGLRTPSLLAVPRWACCSARRPCTDHRTGLVTSPAASAPAFGPTPGRWSTLSAVSRRPRHSAIALTFQVQHRPRQPGSAAPHALGKPRWPTTLARPRRRNAGHEQVLQVDPRHPVPGGVVQNHTAVAAACPSTPTTCAYATGSGPKALGANAFRVTVHSSTRSNSSASLVIIYTCRVRHPVGPQRSPQSFSAPVLSDRPNPGGGPSTSSSGSIRRRSHRRHGPAPSAGPAEHRTPDRHHPAAVTAGVAPADRRRRNRGRPRARRDQGGGPVSAGTADGCRVQSQRGDPMREKHFLRSRPLIGVCSGAIASVLCSSLVGDLR